MKSLPILRTADYLTAMEKAQALPFPEAEERCTRCAFQDVLSNCMRPVSISLGEVEESILVVLPPPTLEDNRNGTLLRSNSVAYVSRLLKSLWSGKVVFDSALRCAPAATKRNNKVVAPTETAFAACRPYAKTTYETVKPKLILLMGTDACRSYLGDALDTTYLHGAQLLLEDGTPVYPLPRPSAVMTNASLRAQFEGALEWAVKNKELRAFPSGLFAQFIETPADVELARLCVEEVGGFTVDVETWGRPFTNTNRLLSLSITPFGSYTAFVWRFKQLQDEALTAGLMAILSDESLRKRNTNMKFDAVHIASTLGVTLKNVDADAMLLRKLAYADANDANLATLQLFVGMYGAKDAVEDYVAEGVAALRKFDKNPQRAAEAFRGIPGDLIVAAAADVNLEGRREPAQYAKTYAYGAIPSKERALYNARDTISTDALCSYMMANSPEHVMHVWETLGKKANHAFTMLQINGLLLDLDAVRAMQEDMDKIVETAQATISELTGGIELNVNAPHQVGQYFFETLGMKGGQRTATGKWQVTDETLEGLSHPVAQAIRDYKQAVKFKTQYADGMLGFMCDDGRVHPQYKIAGTESGRPSCEKPNLLNIPRGSTGFGAKCRSIFRARPGYTFIEGDYNQLELRVAALLSRDPKMIDIFVRDVDYHTETTKLIAPVFGLDPATIDKSHPLRNQAKTLNFKILYGGSDEGIAAELGISTIAAKKMRAAIFGQMTTLARWIDNSVATTRRTGMTRTWWDGKPFRVRPLPNIYSSDRELLATAERCSYNTAIQGTGSDFMNATLGEMQEIIDRENLPAFGVLSVYDSALYEVREDYALTFAKRFQDVATSWNSEGVPLRVDLKIGPVWGKMEGMKC